MTPSLLLTSDGLTPLQLAVREHFQQGGSVTTIVFAVIAVLLVIVALYQIFKRRQQTVSRSRVDDPQRLFKDMLHILELPLQERKLLIRVARDLHLEHPSVLLLSGVLFERYFEQWRSEGRRGAVDEGAAADGLMPAIRNSLFGVPPPGMDEPC